MPLAKRKGWTRLGTVLSLAWLLGTLIYATVEFQTVQVNLTESINSPKPNDPFAALGFEITGQQTFLTNCNVKEKRVSCSPRISRIALLATVPVVIAWILVVAFIWVRAGFRAHETISSNLSSAPAEQHIEQSAKPSKLR